MKTGSKLFLVKKIDTSSILEEYLNNKDDMVYIKLYYQPAHNDSVYIDLISPYWKENKNNVGYILSNEIRTCVTKAAHMYPRLMSSLIDFANEQKGYVSRVMVTSIKNESRYYPHIDVGLFYMLHDRYHLVISSEGSSMIVDGLEKVFKTGDIFYLNNKGLHSGKSLKTENERIHVFFDILPISLLEIFKHYLLWLFVYRKKQKINLFKGILGFHSVIVAVYLSLFTYKHRYKTCL